MIFPITCEEGEQPQITWNYSGEDPQTADATEYEIQGASFRSTVQVTYEVEYSATKSTPSYKQEFSFSFGAVNYRGGFTIIQSGLEYLMLVGADAIWFNAYPFPEAHRDISEANSGMVLIGGVNFGDGRLRETDQIISIEEIAPPLPVLEYSDVTFLIRDGEQQIFIRTEFNQIPQISTNCQLVDQCPENTCKVDCGDHYCCYNADGISIYSFYKS